VQMASLVRGAGKTVDELGHAVEEGASDAVSVVEKRFSQARQAGAETAEAANTKATEATQGVANEAADATQAATNEGKVDTNGPAKAPPKGEDGGNWFYVYMVVFVLVVAAISFFSSAKNSGGETIIDKSTLEEEQKELLKEGRDLFEAETQAQNDLSEIADKLTNTSLTEDERSALVRTQTEQESKVNEINDKITRFESKALAFKRKVISNAEKRLSNEVGARTAARLEITAAIFWSCAVLILVGHTLLGLAKVHFKKE
jgi:vacuolar-type H+-ATPase subunit I/STV1